MVRLMNGKISGTTEERKTQATKIAKDILKRLNFNGIRIQSSKDKEMLKKCLYLVFNGNMTIEEAIELIGEKIVLQKARLQKKIDIYNDFIP